MTFSGEPLSPEAAPTGSAVVAEEPVAVVEGGESVPEGGGEARSTRAGRLDRLTSATLLDGSAAGRAGPWLLLGLSVLFGLIVLRAERLPVAYPNDSAVHQLTVSWAASQLRLGHFPLDGWFPYLSLGSPFFLHYQSFSAVVFGLLGVLIGPAHAFGWSLYLGLSIWPLAVYAGMRIFGFDRWTAAAAAALAPLAVNRVGYGFEHESYIFYGSGLWSQLWGMLLLPIALGFAWRAIARREHVTWAVVTLGGVIILHFLTAYLAGLALLLFAFLRPTELPRRLGRVVVVGLGSVLVAAWVVVPLIATANWGATNEFQVGTFWDDSYGAHQVLKWLFTGSVFDAQLGASRLPVFSVLVAIGFLACLLRFRKDERARLLVGFFLLSLCLYFGRPTLGAALDLLPGNSNLLFSRYISGVQLGGMFLGAVGAVEVARLLVRAAWAVWPRIRGWRGRMAPRLGRVLAQLLPAAALVGFLYPAWHQVGAYDAYSGASIHAQIAADSTEGAELNTLLGIVESEGGGRVYAGMPSNWGYDFRVGSVQVYIYLADVGVDAVGFTLRTASLMTDPEAYFDEANPGDYELFGIHWLILPNGSDGMAAHLPEVPATLVTRDGPFDLWAVGNRGYVHVVDTAGSVAANSNDLGAATRGYLLSPLPSEGFFETVAFNGGRAAMPTVGSGRLPAGPAGVVLRETDDLVEGSVSATVRARRRSVVMLSASFDPGWTVTVDGKPAKTEMIAPALVGVEVSPGTHVVRFRYASYPYYPELFAVSLLTVAGFVIARRRAKSRQA